MVPTESSGDAALCEHVKLLKEDFRGIQTQMMHLTAGKKKVITLIDHMNALCGTPYSNRNEALPLSADIPPEYAEFATSLFQLTTDANVLPSIIEQELIEPLKKIENIIVAATSSSQESGSSAAASPACVNPKEVVVGHTSDEASGSAPNALRRQGAGPVSAASGPAVPHLLHNVIQRYFRLVVCLSCHNRDTWMAYKKAVPKSSSAPTPQLKAGSSPDTLRSSGSTASIHQTSPSRAPSTTPSAGRISTADTLKVEHPGSTPNSSRKVEVKRTGMGLNRQPHKGRGSSPTLGSGNAMPSLSTVLKGRLGNNPGSAAEALPKSVDDFSIALVHQSIVEIKNRFTIFFSVLKSCIQHLIALNEFLIRQGISTEENKNDLAQLRLVDVGLDRCSAVPLEPEESQDEVSPKFAGFSMLCSVTAMLEQRYANPNPRDSLAGLPQSPALSYCSISDAMPPVEVVPFDENDDPVRPIAAVAGSVSGAPNSYEGSIAYSPLLYNETGFFPGGESSVCPPEGLARSRTTTGAYRPPPRRQSGASEQHISISFLPAGESPPHHDSSGGLRSSIEAAGTSIGLGSPATSAKRRISVPSCNSLANSQGGGSSQNNNHHTETQFLLLLVDRLETLGIRLAEELRVCFLPAGKVETVDED